MFEFTLLIYSIPVLVMLAIFSLFYYMDKYDASPKALKLFLQQLLLVKLLRRIILRQARLDSIVVAIWNWKTDLNQREMFPHTTRALVAVTFVFLMVAYTVDLVRMLEQNQYTIALRKAIFESVFAGVVLFSLRFGSRLGRINSKHK